MANTQILWADDEIELLKPHIIFLNEKGYDVTPVSSGADAIEKCSESPYDLVFLDENMPGLTGLETLTQIKTKRPNLPVVMITKSEEEYIMEEAIGSKIADYLIKPLNPKQILSSVKKILDNKRLVTEKTNLDYQKEFQQISMSFNENLDFHEWAEIYKKLIYWELEIDNTEHKSMQEILDTQKANANTNFAKFITQNYESWLNDADAEKPVLSHQLMRKKVFPEMATNKSTFFILIDNLRYDQWKIIEPLIADYFSVTEETSYFSILPTTTAYARNSLFAGMMPYEISRRYPDLWVYDDEEEGKNKNEEALFGNLVKNSKLDLKYSYHKIITNTQGKALVDNLNNLMHNDFNIMVFNFVDMLSHARTDSAMIRELAPDESAYRSITHSWFMHSPLLEIMKLLSEHDVQIMLTTDHGTIRVKRPVKIIGDRETNTNLRYKQGKNLNFNEKEVFYTRKPDQFHLPKRNVSTAYAFAKEDKFFAYPNNYNYYVKYYKDTFQHGGISLEEVIIPFVQLNPKT